MDLSTLTTFQQVILFVLLILGSAILISSTVLIIRKRAFEAKFKHVSNSRVASRRGSALILQNRASKASLEGCSSGNVNGRGNSKIIVAVEQASIPSSSTEDQIQWIDDDQITVSNEQRHHQHNHRIFHMAGVGARPDINNHPRDVTPMPFVDSVPSGVRLKGIIRGTWKYLSSKGRVSRNSQFHGLSSIEREELGGVEYKAVTFLGYGGFSL